MRTLLHWATFIVSATAAPCQSVGIQLTTGIDGGVDLPVDPLFVPATGITIEAWITYDDSTVPSGLFYWPTIARQNLNSNAEAWNLRVNAANNAQRSLAFIVRIGGNLQTISYGFQPGEFAQFTHIAATYDGQGLVLYKNGVSVASIGLPSALPLVFTGGTTRIGNRDPVNPGFESWNGIIDELRIWPMARTAAEIQATMHQSLGGMTGGLLSFPLDGHLFETNTGMQGTQFGTMTYVPGQPSVVLFNAVTSTVGSSTTICGTPIGSLVGSVPQIGNSNFAVWSVRGPVPGSSLFGLLVAATAPAPTNQPPFAGVDLAFGVTSVAASSALPPASPLGNTRFGLPIPNASTLSGVSLIMQFGFADSVCGPQGFSSSSGLSFTVQ